MGGGFCPSRGAIRSIRPHNRSRRSRPRDSARLTRARYTGRQERVTTGGRAMNWRMLLAWVAAAAALGPAQAAGAAVSSAASPYGLAARTAPRAYLNMPRLPGRQHPPPPPPRDRRLPRYAQSHSRRGSDPLRSGGALLVGWRRQAALGGGTERKNKLFAHRRLGISQGHRVRQNLRAADRRGQPRRQAAAGDALAGLRQRGRGLRRRLQVARGR